MSAAPKNNLKHDSSQLESKYFPRNKRLEARVTQAQKDLLVRAATIKGQTITDFVVTCAQEEAKRVLEDYESMILTKHDRDVFVEALLNDMAPCPKLKKAAKSYLDK